MSRGGDAPAIELTDGTIEGPRGKILDQVSWSVPDRCVTALVGPAGSGKSTVMRVLAGVGLPDGWRVEGSWRFRGQELLGAEGAAPKVVWCGQQSREGGRPPIPCADVFRERADLYLLDEPNRQASGTDLDELALRAREAAGRAPVIVVTHDLKFARRVADHVALLCAGQIAAEGEARTFFDVPPSQLAARFVDQGNCWPDCEGFPTLPPHFHWVLPGRLAGMGCPGILGSVEEDLTAVAYSRVSVLVSLTEEAFPRDELRRFGIRARHFPIQDMGVPAISKTARLCREIERYMERGEVVAVHCRAGMGRTGTILAVMLVWMGRAPDEAIDLVRRVAPGYIQTRSQEQFIHRFAESV